jgi:branched-chain amino acid aminotransferase
MPEPLAFLNGQLLPQSQASLSFSDAGFVFGATITDFCRTFRQKPYLLERHLERLRADAALIGITLTPSADALIESASKLVAHNATMLRSEQELGLVTFSTPGPIGYYAGQQGNGPPTLGMHTFPLPFARYARFFRDGSHLVTPSIRQATQGTGIKHRSRLHWWLASQQISTDSIALLLDEKEHVTETALANFLIVHKGTVLTPPAHSVLWGISIGVIEQLCDDLGIPFEQAPLSLEDCKAASEAMICGTAFCLAGVSRINDHAIPWPGPICKRLLDAWSKDVGLDISSQFFPPG